MKNLLSVFCLVFLSISLVSQSAIRELDRYNKLEVSGGVEVVLFDGTPKAEIEIIKGDLDDLETEVRNGVLSIKFEKKSWFSWSSDNKAKIKLYGAQLLSEVSSSAGSNVNTELELGDKSFEISVSSGSSVQLILHSQDVSVSASSGASVNLSGSCRDMEASASSGASVDASDLESENAEVSASSGALIKLWATNKLGANASSGGSVKYKGEPSYTEIKPGKYSGGSISKM